MEPISDAAKRALEHILDEWVSLSMDLPDGEQRRRLNEKIAALEKHLMAETT